METLWFEITPSFSIDKYNKRRSITRCWQNRHFNSAYRPEKLIFFLPKGKFLLPLLPGYTSDEFKVPTDNSCSGVKLVEDEITFESSPIAGICRGFNRVGNILEAFCYDGDESFEFETLEVYFMVFQTGPEQIRLNLRRYKRWQEHQMYRMQETHKYQLLAHADSIREGDYWSKIKVTLHGMFLRDKEDELKFEYPDTFKKWVPEIVRSSRWIMQLGRSKNIDSVRTDFEQLNLKAFQETDDKIVLKLLSLKKLESSSAVVEPSRLLSDILNYFNNPEGQLEFLSIYWMFWKARWHKWAHQFHLEWHHGYH